MNKYAFNLLIFILLFISSKKTMASHAMGADLIYTCLGGNQYEVTYWFYRYCDGIPAPSAFTVNVTAPGCSNANLNVTLYCTNFNNPTEISPVCPTDTSNCNGGTFIGVQEYIYTGIITLPAACANWTLSVSECCRNSTITTVANPSGYNLFLYSTLNNTSGICNNSPTFANNPVPFACTGQRFCFNHGAFDVDGDSLVYQLITPRSGPAAADTVSYVAGYSASQPVLSQPGNPAVQVHFDPVTGDMCMDPIQNDITLFAVLVSEYRNGVLIGQVERDIQLSVLACSNHLPLISGINGLLSPQPYTINACAGTPVNFFIASDDSDQTNSTYLNWDYAIPGATFTTYGGSNTFGGHRDSARFTWTPTVADIGRSICFTVSASDNNCPILGTTYSSYCINVKGVAVDAGTDVSVSCGQCTTLTAVNLGGTGPYTYTWNPGNVQSTTLSPACVGQYIVSIRDNNNCTNSDTVNVNPSAGNIQARFNTTNNCTGSPIQFTDQSIGATPNSWLWLFGDGGTSNIQNPSHQYGSAGNYNVTLIVTASSSCIDTIVQPVTFTNIAPIAQISTNNICQGNIMNFNSSNSTGGPFTNYAWDFGDTISGSNNTNNTPNPSHYFPFPGNYVITLEINNMSGCSNTVQQNVTVYPNPTLIILPQQICAGQQAILACPAIYNTYTWSTGEITQSISVNPSITTNYTLTVTDTNNCSTTASTQVVVNTNFVANAGNDQTICNGTYTTISGTVSGNLGNYSYLWSNGTNSAVTTVGPGTYVLTVTNGICNSIDTVVINGSSSLTPSTTISATSIGSCNSRQFLFTANATNGGTAPTFQWYLNSIPVGIGPSILLTNLNNGNQVFCAMTSNAACTSTPIALSDTIIVSIGNGGASIPTITVSGTILASSPANSYQWLLNGNTILGATGQFYQAVVNGFYQVIILDANGCSATSNFILINSIGIDPVDPALKGTMVYPNPALDIAFLEIPKNLIVNAELFSNDGKKIDGIFQGNTGNSTRKIQCPISGLPNGLYVIKISTEKGSLQLRFVITH